MVYYQVQFIAPIQGVWITVKEFDDSSGTLSPVFDSAEQLSLEEAETRLAFLSKKYPHIAFRINKVIL
ncbi:hypothetical protein [Spirosoma flavum]|uniref:DUF1902 domain-containing protein n=1 Tax=Spirosoma flavum TaxID=2048557 RepID=A0ABW6AS16_9BACT